jgi:site-specific DNA recombinase
MSSDKLRLEPPPSSLPAGSTVWAYLRDSGGPTQERSVEQQREMILEYCTKYNLILSLPPFEDVHKSGGTTQGRNDFDYMMSLSTSSEKPNGLLVWNFARFSRGGAVDSQLYKSILRHRGIVIHSLTDKIPEGEFGPVIETIIDIANKQKKDEAAMGAWRGLRHNVKQGAVPGFPPVGMKRTPIKITSIDGIERRAHRRDPDPNFKSRINKAFQMKAEGKSLGQIHAKTKLFNSINSYTTFFQNPIYIGTLHFGDMIIEKYCAPTVPRKLWDKVQTILQAAMQRKHMNSIANHPRRTNSVYILSGIIKCARCGSPMNGMNSPQPYSDDYLRYRCAAAKIKKTCTAKPVPAKIVEEMVIKELLRFFDEPQNLINVLTTFQTQNANRQQTIDEELASLTAQLATVRKKLSNTVNAIAEKAHSQALLKKLSTLEQEEIELQSQIAKLKSQSNLPVFIPNEEQAKVAIHKIKADLQSKDPAFIRQTLLGIIHEVIIDRNGRHIIGRVVYYHTPELKKKPPTKLTVSIFPTPVGAPIYRHSLFFEATIPPPGRPKKKK